MTRLGWFLLLSAALIAVLVVCIVAVAEPMPQIYPDAEEFMTGGGAAGDLKMLGHDIYTDADSDSRWEHGTDDQIGLWLNAAGPQCLVTTAAATWTVQAIFSGVTADITTAAGEDLTLDPAGAGSTVIVTDHSVGSEFKLSTVAAGSIVGPIIMMTLADGTPAADDDLGVIQWYGQDSALASQHYGTMFGVTVDPTATSEDFRLDTWAYVAGSEKKVQELGMTTQGWGQSLWYRDDGALGPTLGFTHSSASPLAADVLGRVIWAGKDSGAADQEYVRIEAINVDPTVAGGEDGRLDIKPFVAGAQATLMSVGAVPDYAGNLVQGVALQNGEYFRNTDNGDICFGANGGTNPEDLCFDFDYASDQINIKAGGSGMSDLMLTPNLALVGNARIAWSGAESILKYDAIQAPDSMLWGLGTSNESLIFVQVADMATSVDFPDQDTPTIVLQNADATAPTKRLWLQHDGTDGKIAVGSGGLKVAAPTLTASAATGEYGWVFDQTLNAAAGTNDGGITTETYNGLKINLTTTDTAGWDSVYALSVYDDGTIKGYLSAGGTFLAQNIYSAGGFYAGVGAAGVDYVVMSINGETYDADITYYEDEDRLQTTSSFVATASYAAEAGLTGTGATTGAGVYGTGGASNGSGGQFYGGATNGGGVYGQGAGTGTGARGVGGATGYGCSCEADTSSPVRATMHLSPQDAAPSTPAEGDIYANVTDHHLYYYNGTGWLRLDNVP